MRAKQIKKFGMVSILSLGAAFALAACGSTITAQNTTIDVNSTDMRKAENALVHQGYRPLMGSALTSALRNRTFSYRDGKEDANVNVTYFENGVASMTWNDDDGGRGMKKRLWSMEQSKYLCIWDRSDEDECASVFTKAGQLATANDNGDIHYMTGS